MINISSKYIIILIFFTCLFVAFKKDKNIETLDCLISLNDLARNMYRQEVYKQLEKKGLNQEQMGVLYNDIFEKTKKIYDYEITLEKYLKSEKIETDGIIDLIVEIVNERRFSNPLYDYIIDKDTKIADIKNTIITRDMKNRLVCGFKTVSEIENFMDKLSNFLFSFRNIPCNAPRFVDWCNTKLKNKDPDANFALSRLPISLVLNGFNAEKIGGEYLVNLISNYESENNITFSQYDYKNVIGLLKLQIVNLKGDIVKYKAIPKENIKERIAIIKILKPKINVFYELKAYYKLVRIYSYIKDNLETTNSKFKENALSCCGNFKYPYKCYNFSDKKSKSDNGIFGFEKYGFVKDSKCSGETLKDEYDLENITVLSFFDKDTKFSNMSENDKSRFYDDIKSFYLSNNIRLSGKIENKVINRIKDEVGDKQDLLANLFGKELTSKPNNSLEKYKYNKNDKLLIEFQKEILTLDKTNLVLIQENLQKLFNFDENQHYIDPNLFLDNKKEIAEKFINNFQVMVNLHYYSKNVLMLEEDKINEFVFSCLGLRNKEIKYSNIFAINKIPIRFQNIIMAELEKIIRECKGIEFTKDKFDIDNLVSEIMKSNDLLPGKKEVYPCKKYNLVLQDLRDQKLISYFDLKKFNNRMKSICEKNN